MSRSRTRESENATPLGWRTSPGVVANFPPTIGLHFEKKYNRFQLLQCIQMDMVCACTDTCICTHCEREYWASFDPEVGIYDDEEEQTSCDETTGESCSSSGRTSLSDLTGSESESDNSEQSGETHFGAPAGLVRRAAPRSGPRDDSSRTEPTPNRLAAPTRGRLRSRAYFLTYSQTQMAKERLVQWLQSENRVKRFIVALENHRDGGKHLHALVEYDVRKDVNTSHFDIGSEHPNIKACTRNSPDYYKAWLADHWRYCLKEDIAPYIFGEAPEDVPKKQRRDEIARKAIGVAREQGAAAAMQLMEEHCAMELLRSFNSVRAAFMAVRNDAQRPQSSAKPTTAFPHAPLIVDNWQVLYINGPTGMGKTAWARSLLPEATVVRHRDQLRTCDFSKGVIFDDFDVSHWPPTAVIHLLDWDETSGIDVKHGHVEIPPHTRKIFTHNKEFDRWTPQESSDEQVSAMRRRVHVVNIHRSLF